MFVIVCTFAIVRAIFLANSSNQFIGEFPFFPPHFIFSFSVCNDIDFISKVIRFYFVALYSPILILLENNPPKKLSCYLVISYLKLYFNIVSVL